MKRTMKPNRARPRQVHLYLTEEEYVALRHAAARHDLSLSAMLRRWIKKSVR